MGGFFIFSNRSSFQFLVSLCLMNNLILHKVVKFTRSFPISQVFSLLIFYLSLLAHNFFVFSLLHDAFIVLVSDLLLDSLLWIKHHSVDALGNLLFDPEFLFPPLFVESFESFLIIKHVDCLLVGPVFYLCNEIDSPSKWRVIVFSILGRGRPFKSRKFTSGIHLNNLDNYIAKVLNLIILKKQTNNL